MSIDIQQFKKTLSLFPTGVCVITCQDTNSKPLGITVNSFNSVSLNPPLILWSINKDTHSADVFTSVEHFAVNMLADEQNNLSNQFASNVADRFNAVDYHVNAYNTPILGGVVAYLQCKHWQVYDGGDHHIIIGEAIHSFADAGKSALLYYQGNYASTATCPKGRIKE